jgi:hypothetical protein
MKSTVTPSNSAEPFWFIAEPAVSTNRATCLGRARFSSATRSAVGSVADDDAVEKAVTMARRTPEKNRRGLMPPKNFTDTE